MSESASLQVLDGNKIIRRLRKPFFLFRTQDRLGHYFERVRYRIVHYHREPLSAFLAPAKYDEEKAELVYDLKGVDLHTLTPMEYLPDTIIHAFVDAANAFYGVDGFDARITEGERALRRFFKLPDPDSDPGAYWLHGPPDNRQLLILWGTELVEGSSLPLVAIDAKSNQRQTIHGRMIRRRMQWADRQKDALLLLQKRPHPLNAFLAQAEYDRKGEIVHYRVAGEKIPAKAVKPLAKIWQGPLNAFSKALTGFYQDCHADADTISAYEQEMRQAFKLPDPEQLPDQFLAYRKSFFARPFFIMISGKESEDQCLWPKEDDALPIPPLAKDKAEGAGSDDTLLQKLQERVHPSRLYATAGAAAAALFTLATILAWVFWVDNTPPELIHVVAENDPNQILVEFSEPVDAESLMFSADPKVADSRPSFLIVDSTGATLPVQRVAALPDEPNRVVLTVNDMQEGHEYRLIVHHVRDQSIRSNMIAAGSDARFTFVDTLPPGEPLVSAEGSDSRKLLLKFDEAIEERSARNRNNFQIENFGIMDAELAEDGRTVILTAENENRGLEDRGFRDLGRYTITVSGLRDRSSQGNVIPTYRIPDFEYVDRFPPALRAVQVEDQFRLRVRFNKPVDPASALLVRNYRITVNAGERPEILRVLPGESGNEVILETSGLFNGVEYLLEAAKIGDLSSLRNIADQLESEPFRFTGREDRDPPQITRIRMRQNRTELIIDWNEPVRIEQAGDPANYQFVQPTGLSIISVRPLSPNNTQFVLNLSEATEGHRRYQLQIKRISDRLGNALEDLASPEFRGGVYAIYSTDLQVRVAAVSSTELRLIFNEALINHEARINDLTYFKISESANPMNTLMIIESQFNPQEATEVRLILSAETPLMAKEYTLVVEPGMRIQKNRGSDQHSLNATFRYE